VPTRISQGEFASLTRPFHVVTPHSTNGIGNVMTAWTCHGSPGVFLQYDSGVTVMEDDSTPFDNDPGGAAGYFRTATARGDGRRIGVAGFPGSMTIGDGHDPKGVVVEFIGGGDRILVRTDNPSTDPAWLTAIARGIARQLA
jgi:hypothetical protein